MRMVGIDDIGESFSFNAIDDGQAEVKKFVYLNNVIMQIYKNGKNIAGNSSGSPVWRRCVPSDFCNLARECILTRGFIESEPESKNP